MKPFEWQTKTARKGAPTRTTGRTPTADDCAALLLDTVPRIMRALRQAIAALESPALTLPQFRTLHFVHTHAGANLSATADFLGLTLPSTSKLVDQLVRRSLLARDNDAADRRRMTLRLTDKGDALLKNAQASVRLHLAGALTKCDGKELIALHLALDMLQQSFPSPFMVPSHETLLAGPGCENSPSAPRAAVS